MTKHLRFFMLTLLTIVCTVGMAQDETVWKSLSFPDDNKAINFTLLHDIGDIRINQTATDEEIREALDFIREGY